MAASESAWHTQMVKPYTLCFMVRILPPPAFSLQAREIFRAGRAEADSER